LTLDPDHSPPWSPRIQPSSQQVRWISRSGRTHDQATRNDAVCLSQRFQRCILA